MIFTNKPYKNKPNCLRLAGNTTALVRAIRRSSKLRPLSKRS